MRNRDLSLTQYPCRRDSLSLAKHAIFLVVAFSLAFRSSPLNGQTPSAPVTAAPAPGTPTPSPQSVPLTPAQKSVLPSATSGFVGVETCKLCHIPEANGMHSNPHWKLELEGKHEVGIAPTCEECHGPGQAHVESGGDKTKIFRFTTATPKEADKRCLSCHQTDGDHDNFLRSAHSEGQIGCLGCHTVHGAKTPTGLLKAATPALCYTCHTDIRGQFSRPMHHRVDEGLIKCTNCHNPHGATLDKLLRTASTGDAICTKCHTEKMGPFTFEHPPIKTEGCVSCHTPHGSQNPRLLNRSNVNTICLQCHTDSTFTAPGAPSFHNQAVQYQACTICHVSIHGSNFNPYFFK